jgi:hypothetical protein
LDPPGLSARDLLRLTEILEVFVVSTNANRVFSTEEEWSATFEAKNNTKELLVVGVVVGFCRKETAGVEGDGMKTVVIFLGDNHSQGVARGV